LPTAGRFGLRTTLTVIDKTAGLNPGAPLPHLTILPTFNPDTILKRLRQMASRKKGEYCFFAYFSLDYGTLSS
jgi:hypothetical protein